MKVVSASCPGSCGELFQCVIGDNECLLSYNIDKRSYVKICEDTNAMGISCLGNKMQRVLALLPELTGVRLEHYLEFPVGKGCSSSTADMLSSLKALSLYQGITLDNDTLTHLCAQIEPTDSVGFDKWTVIDPLTGHVIWQTEWQPELYVYLLEPIETLKTIDLVRMKNCHLYPAKTSANLLEMFKEACREENLKKLGHLATESAVLNNKRLPKPYLEEIIVLSEELGCLGVNIAHSGTVIGILLSKKGLCKVDELERRLQKTPIGIYYQRRTLCQIIYEGVCGRRGEDLLND